MRSLMSLTAIANAFDAFIHTETISIKTGIRDVNQMKIRKETNAERKIDGEKVGIGKQNTEEESVLIKVRF